MPFDSLVTADTLGPPNVPSVQHWEAGHAYGPVIIPATPVELHGVRWWRIGQTVSDDGVGIRVWIDGTTDPLGEIELSGDAPTVTGWREYLFPAPIPLDAGVPVLVGIGMARPDDLAHSPGYWPANQPSIRGLYRLSIAGRWAWDPPDPTAPPAIADTVWHWIDPLVDLPPEPPDPDAMPDERIIRIAADDRTTAIAADDRAIIIPAENRTVEVPA